MESGAAARQKIIILQGNYIFIIAQLQLFFLIISWLAFMKKKMPVLNLIQYSFHLDYIIEQMIEYIIGKSYWSPPSGDHNELLVTSGYIIELKVTTTFIYF